MSKQLLILNDIKSTIRLLRFLTQRNGFVSVSIDESPSENECIGDISLILRNEINVIGSPTYTPEELLDEILEALWASNEKLSLEELNSNYKKTRWNDLGE